MLICNCYLLNLYNGIVVVKIWLYFFIEGYARPAGFAYVDLYLFVFVSCLDLAATSWLYSVRETFWLAGL